MTSIRVRNHELHKYLLLANIILCGLNDGSMAVYNLHTISHCIAMTSSSICD